LFNWWNFLEQKNIMLWKPYRLRKNWEFQKILSEARKLFNDSFTIFFAGDKLNNCRFGISVPHKLVKKSVKRNHYKRQIRSMLIQYLKRHNESCQTSDKHYHYNFVIITRLGYLDSNFTTNRENLYKLLQHKRFDAWNWAKDEWKKK